MQLLVVVVTLYAFVSSVSSVSPSASCVFESSVLNSYYPGEFVNTTDNTVHIGIQDVFSIPSVVLIIQMQEGTIVETNDFTYGDGTGRAKGYLNSTAGTYQFNIIQSSQMTATGTILTMQYTLKTFTRSSNARFQVITVPFCVDTVINGTQPSWISWNGEIGGVVALLTFNLTLDTDIDISGTGFRGADAFVGSCGNNFNGAIVDTSMNSSSPVSPFSAIKGEGIIGTPYSLNTSEPSTYPGGWCARGAPGNAGGGSNCCSAGGGGGGNCGEGGDGSQPNYRPPGKGGLGGADIAASVGPDRIFLGGSGGAGGNDGTSSWEATRGLNGGGILYFHVEENFYAPSGSRTIISSGQPNCCGFIQDGGGGGGAGGTVIFINRGLYAGSTMPVNIIVSGGPGQTGGAHDLIAGGGGGGGGCFYSNTEPSTSQVNAGAQGINGLVPNTLASSGIKSANIQEETFFESNKIFDDYLNPSPSPTNSPSRLSPSPSRLSPSSSLSPATSPAASPCVALSPIISIPLSATISLSPSDSPSSTVISISATTSISESSIPSLASTISNTPHSSHSLTSSASTPTQSTSLSTNTSPSATSLPASDSVTPTASSTLFIHKSASHSISSAPTKFPTASPSSVIEVLIEEEKFTVVITSNIGEIIGTVTFTTHGTLPPGVILNVNSVNNDEAPPANIFSTIVSLTLTLQGQEIPLQGEVEICLKGENIDEDKIGDYCLGFVDGSNKWECEDRCLDEKQGGEYCGKTDHFTNFAILLDTGGGGDPCNSDAFDSIFVIISVVSVGVALLVICFAVLVLELRFRIAAYRQKKRIRELGRYSQQVL